MTSLPHCAVIGAGRLGSALAAALGAEGPLGRGADGAGADCVLLCVPDAEIPAAAAAIAEGRLVGHCSGATTLAPLAAHEAFSMHPLMTVSRADIGFAGVAAAVAGSTPRALSTATALARGLGMRPFTIADDDRAAYHAAACMASNYLITLEDAAARLLATTGAGRELLAPLVRATVENWAREGAAALTGPVARGDSATVALQRAAVQERTPNLLGLFDALTESTMELA